MLLAARGITKTFPGVRALDAVDFDLSAGEILALYPLFAQLSTAFELEVKERGSLINGSPCAAALVADSAIAAQRRLRLQMSFR